MFLEAHSVPRASLSENCSLLGTDYVRGQISVHIFAPNGGYINNSLHLVRKYARIFVRGHYLFREANSFPRAKLEENCELRGTDNVQGQISGIFLKPNGCYCVYYPSNIFLQGRISGDLFSKLLIVK